MCDFDSWSALKERLHNQQKVKLFTEAEVWWCSIGLNIGYELYGKNVLYTRPVLILRKYSNRTFFGLPLTSKRKNRTSYYHCPFGGRDGSVILEQGRTMDAKRLEKRMGELSANKFKDVWQAFKKYH